jgi:hypothetical protein
MTAPGATGYAKHENLSVSGAAWDDHGESNGTRTRFAKRELHCGSSAPEEHWIAEDLALEPVQSAARMVRIQRYRR